jgi:hypothetical protein
MIDRKAPGIAISSPTATTYLLNRVVVASYACSDGGSGVASCVGTVPNGAAVATSSVGTKTFAVNAADAVGNAGGTSLQYRVTYRICVLANTDKPKKNKLRLLLRLCDVNAANVSSPSVTVTAQALDGNPLVPPVDFSYASHLRGKPGYSFELDTRALPPGTHTLAFTASGDPVQHSVSFQVK